MGRRGWSAAPDRWVQFIRGPRHKKAKSTVTRLEKASDAMGDVEGPAVEVLKSELTTARAASQQPPLMSRSISAAKTSPEQRSERLSLGFPSRTRGCVTPANGERVAIRAGRTCEGVARGLKWCRRSTHSSYSEETSRLEAERAKAEQHEALLQGDLQHVSELGRVVTEGVNHLIEITYMQPSVSGEHDHGMKLSNLVTHQRGFEGCRVGEASNPGPRIRRLLRLVEGRDVSRKTTQEDSDSDAPLLSLPPSVPGESPHPTRRSARLQALGSRAGHRRGLIVELAPNVVDASAVALHVITDVEFDCDASAPVFDPLESDEEEFHALSRNVTSVVVQISKGQPRWIMMMAVSFHGCTRTVHCASQESFGRRFSSYCANATRFC